MCLLVEAFSLSLLRFKVTKTQNHRTGSNFESHMLLSESVMVITKHSVCPPSFPSIPNPPPFQAISTVSRPIQASVSFIWVLLGTCYHEPVSCPLVSCSTDSSVTCTNSVGANSVLIICSPEVHGPLLSIQ